MRPTNNFGPTQHEEKLIPTIAKCLAEEKKIKLHNNGDPVRNWCHVSNTVSANFFLYELWLNGRHVANNVYNISANYELPNWVVVWRSLKITNKLGYGSSYPDKKDIKPFVDYSYNRPGQDIRYSLNTEKINSLGWEPTQRFDDNLRTILARYNTKKYLS
jgi:dTDP-glucose 4,6-dehydratase